MKLREQDINGYIWFSLYYPRNRDIEPPATGDVQWWDMMIKYRYEITICISKVYGADILYESE